MTSVFLTIFGLIIGYATSKGLHLPFSAETATTVTVGVILFAFSYYNAKYKNNLFDEETDTIYIPIDNLSDQQINAINNFIEKAVQKNMGQEIPYIDPASEYGDENAK